MGKTREKWGKRAEINLYPLAVDCICLFVWNCRDKILVRNALPSICVKADDVPIHHYNFLLLIIPVILTVIMFRHNFDASVIYFCKKSPRIYLH